MAKISRPTIKAVIRILDRKIEMLRNDAEILSSSARRADDPLWIQYHNVCTRIDNYKEIQREILALIK